MPKKCLGGVVYYIYTQCESCGSSSAYIGKTINTLYERFYGPNGHLHPNSQKSALLEHLGHNVNPSCELNIDNVKILDICNNDLELKKNPAPYRTRSQSESAAIVDKNKQLTPKHDKSAPHSTKFSTPLSDTPSTSRVCDICKGMQDLRNFKLKEVVAEFESKIEAYKDLTKSQNNNNSMLNHALDAIKHFIMRTEPNDIDTFFSKTNEKISALSENVHDLSKYVTKLDSVVEFVNKKIDNVLSNSLTISEPNSEVIKRLDNLE